MNPAPGNALAVEAHAAPGETFESCLPGRLDATLEAELGALAVRAYGHLAERVTAYIADSGIPCTFSGGPWMPFITFHRDSDGHYKRLREAFYTQLIRRGVFLQPYHHGYIAYRHIDEDLDHAADMIAESLDRLKTVI